MDVSLIYPTVNPMQDKVRTLLATLTSSVSRDELKYRALKDLEEFISDRTGPVYDAVVEELSKSFLILMKETQPKFLSENSTLQLRKLALELLLRISTCECMRPLAITFHQLLINELTGENEECALIILKILMEHIRIFRVRLNNELGQLIDHWKNAIAHIKKSAAEGEMFKLRPTPVYTDLNIETCIENALGSCYYTSNFFHQCSTNVPEISYTIIPRTIMSLKFLAELFNYIIALVQANRSNSSEIAEWIRIFVDFLSVKLPNNLRYDPSYIKELGDEFYNAQIRALTFLAYITRQSADLSRNYISNIIDSVNEILDQLPGDLVGHRRELIVSMKFLFSSDFKKEFVVLVPKLCDERLLIGTSFTSMDQLRSKNLVELADNLYHVRMDLDFDTLTFIYYKTMQYLQDLRLSPRIQILYCKSMMNFVEPLMISSEGDSEHLFEIFSDAAAVLANKLKHIAENSVVQHLKLRNAAPLDAHEQTHTSEIECLSRMTQSLEVDHQSSHSGPSTYSAQEAGLIYWHNSASFMSLSECKNAIRFVIYPLKMITNALSVTKVTRHGWEFQKYQIYSEIFKSGLRCIDLCLLGSNSMQKQSMTKQKDPEKELVEAYVSLFVKLDVELFRYIFKENVEVFVDLCCLNPLLQQVLSLLLYSNRTSFESSKILLDYLIKKLPDFSASNGKNTMDATTSRTSIYIRLIRMIFQWISQSSYMADECADLLKTSSQKIFTQSLRLALFCKDPTNYFLLLRVVLRFVSTSHDFTSHLLPILPSALFLLNRLQRSTHRQHQKELFTEISLMVPVRILSQPQVFQLFDSIIIALSGSDSMKMHAIKIFELCANTLEPDYFFEHITTSKRRHIIDGLWRTVISPDQNVSMKALKALGKLGGVSRMISTDSHILEFRPYCSKASFSFTFDHVSRIKTPILLPGLISLSTSLLRIMQVNDIPLYFPENATYVRENLKRLQLRAFYLIKTFILNSISSKRIKELDTSVLKSVLKKSVQNARNSNDLPYTSSDFVSRKLFIDAITGLFYAVYDPALRNRSLSLFKSLLRYLSAQSFLESSQENFSTNLPVNNCLDSSVLVDAIIATLSDSTKEFSHPAILALRYIIETGRAILGNNEQTSPFLNNLLERILLLMHQPPWYIRIGGCTALRQYIMCYPKSFLLSRITIFFDSFLEIFSGLSNDVSNGTFELSFRTLESLLSICFKNKNDHAHPKDQLLEDIDKRLIANFFSTNEQLLSYSKRILLLLVSITRTSPIEHVPHQYTLELLTEKAKSFSCLSLEEQRAFLDAYLFIANIDEEKGLALLNCIPIYVSDHLVQNLITIFKKDLNLCEHIGKNSFKYGESVNFDEDKIFNLSIEIKLKIIQLLSKRTIQLILFPTSNMDPIDNDIEDTDLREPQLPKRTRDLLNFLLGLIDINASFLIFEEAKRAIESIVKKGANYCNALLDTHLKQIISQINNDENVLLTGQVQQISFLIAVSHGKLGLEQIRPIIEKLFGLDNTTEISSTDLDFVSNSIVLIVQVVQSEDEEYPRIVKAILRIMEHAYYTISNLCDFPQILNHLLNLLMVDLTKSTEILLSYQQFQNDLQVHTILELVDHKNSTLLRSSFIDHASIIARFISQKDSYFVTLNALRLVLKLVELEPILINKNPEITSSVKNLWFDAHCEHHTIASKKIGKNHNLTKTQQSIQINTAKILIDFIRSLISEGDDSSAISLLYDLCIVFTTSFVADFEFVRIFINNDIIPIVSLEFRRAAFRLVVQMLRADIYIGGSEHLQCFMQYFVCPAITYSFDFNDADEVVGGPPDPENANDDNIVSCLCTEIIDKFSSQDNRTILSDRFTILLYQFCVVLVQKCPAHIHDLSKKQQGNRLRSFMLFGWNCLQTSFQRDTTEKYTGYFLIVTIISQFTINRRIVLQVLNGLFGACIQDPREVVKKSLDILIPIIPKRMEDGYAQLLTIVKKTITDETKDSVQTIIHCLSIVIRHSKTFYCIRHQLAPILLNSLQRLFSISIQFMFDARRVAIELCECIIRWEQDRQKFLEADSSTVVQTPSFTTQTGDHVKFFEHDIIDSVTLILLRLSTTTDNQQTPPSSSGSPEHMGRKATILFRIAMQPDLFGNIASIKTELLEGQLLLSSTQLTLTNQAQIVQTLEFLVNIIGNVPSKVIHDIFGRLQHSLISCASINNSQISRTTYGVVAKLIAKAYLEDFPLLNQYVQDTIQNTFIAFTNAISFQPQTLSSTIMLLRVVVQVQPTFLERPFCLNPFLRMLQRLARDYATPVLTYGSSSYTHIDQAQKHFAELLCVCLEMAYARITLLSFDSQRIITQYVIVPLIEKNAIDKILEIILKISHKMVSVDHQAESNGSSYSHLSVRQGILILAQMLSNLEQRMMTNASLTQSFIYTILYIYEKCSELINFSPSDLEGLERGFYMGLTSTNLELQTRFFAIFERKFPADIFDRIIYSMKNINWALFGTHFWLNHVVHVLLMSKNSNSNALLFNNCSTLYLTFERVIFALLPAVTSSGIEEPDVPDTSGISQVEEKMDVEYEDLTMAESATRSQNHSGMDIDSKLDDSQLSSLQVSFSSDTGESSHEDDTIIMAILGSLVKFTKFSNEITVNDLVISVIDLIQCDHLLAKEIFIELFYSLYNGLNAQERAQLNELTIPFLSSGVMLQQIKSPVPVVVIFLEAFIRCDIPLQQHPEILSYIGSTYNCWHLVISLLEKSTGNIRPLSQSILSNGGILSHENVTTLTSLLSLYRKLNEFDQVNVIWKRMAHFPDTIKCHLLYTQDDFVHARDLVERTISQINERTLDRSTQKFDQFKSAAFAIQTEANFLEHIWIESCKQLNDWDSLEHFANNEDVTNAEVLLEAAWHSKNWNLATDCIHQLETYANPLTFFRTSMLQLMQQLVKTDEQTNTDGKEIFEKIVSEISKELVTRKQNLPKIVSHPHIQLQTNAQLLFEISEAHFIKTSLYKSRQPVDVTSQQDDSSIVISRTDVLEELDKLWRTTPVSVVDPVNTLIDIFNWRYQCISSVLGTNGISDEQIKSSVYCSLFKSQILLARKFRLSSEQLIPVAINELNKLHLIESVQPTEAFMKLDENIKCLIQLASTSNASVAQDSLYETLEIVEKAQIQFVKLHQVSQLLVHKGVILGKLDKRDEALRAFSAAALLESENVDDNTNSSSLWRKWGNYLSSIFSTNHSDSTIQTVGLQAISSLLEGARNSSPKKSRKPIAKILWLLKICSSCSSQPTSEIDSLIRGYISRIPFQNWLFWLDALVYDVRQRPGISTTELLCTLSEVYPHQLLAMLRLNLCPKDITKAIEQFCQENTLIESELPNSDDMPLSSIPLSYSFFTEKYYTILKRLCSSNIVFVSTLNRLLNEFDELPATWIERTLCEFRSVISSCHSELFTNISESDVIMLPRKLLERLNCFMVSLREESIQDDAESKLLERLLSDFEVVNTQGRIVLEVLIQKLGKWISILLKHFDDSCFIRKLRNTSIFLANFDGSKMPMSLLYDHSMQSYQISPQILQFVSTYHARIFNQSICTVIRVRSMSGEIYHCYLERIPFNRNTSNVDKLMNLLNNEFVKYRGTAQRSIQFCVSPSAFTGPNNRLIVWEEKVPSNQPHWISKSISSPTAISFTDIFDECLRTAKCGFEGQHDIVDFYYSRLSEKKYSYKSLFELFGQISGGNHSQIQDRTHIVPRNILNKWMESKYPDASDYWSAKKTIAVKLALLAFSESAFHWTPLMLDKIVFECATAQLFATYGFDMTVKVHEMLRKVPFVELDANKPVPFRLTPNITNFLDLSVEGHFIGSMIAIARCLNSRTVEHWLRPILWDVIYDTSSDDLEMNDMLASVKRAVETILRKLKEMAVPESKNYPTSLLATAQQSECLCRMDPAWHPWF